MGSWFTPPIVIPTVIVLVIVAIAINHAFASAPL
jgi:hypothetical protein